MNRNKTLKQKDFDSYCTKYIRFAEKTGACRFTPSKNHSEVFKRISELVEKEKNNLLCSFHNGEIVIIKQQSTQPIKPSPRKERPKPQNPLMFVPLKKAFPTPFQQHTDQ